MVTIARDHSIPTNRGAEFFHCDRFVDDARGSRPHGARLEVPRDIAGSEDDRDFPAQGADPLSDVVARADYLRDRIDINPFQVGALCVGEPAAGWLDAVALRGAAFLIHVTVHAAGLPYRGIVRESTGPCGAPLLDVLASSSPLEPEVTRLVDAWLLRHVTIRA